ncbi:MAG: class I SAM-dependent methyltransferase [Solirubrobacteraceae bacterium]
MSANRTLTIEAPLAQLDGAAALAAIEAELRRAEIPTEAHGDGTLSCRWEPVGWARGQVSARIRANARAQGVAVTLELEGWDALAGFTGREDELAAWLGGRIFAPAIAAASPDVVAAWLTDRLARRPEGRRAKETYASVPEHQPGFDAVLEGLRLAPDDVLLEVGCGGGILLEQALASGCRAVGVDHSGDMLELAAERNAAAVAAGRLELRLADAAALGLAEDSFTCAAMAHAYFFLPDPVAALQELRRVLVPGGRIAIVTTAPELKGHPGAAPEPLASQTYFWTDAQLAGHAQEADLHDVLVARRDGRQLLQARA